MRIELGRPTTTLRAAEEARIDAEAAALAEAVRPASLSRMDAARVAQARAVLGGAGPGRLIEDADHADLVLAAADATDRRLAAIETARLAAKARVRAATTPNEMRQVRVEIPDV